MLYMAVSKLTLDVQRWKMLLADGGYLESVVSACNS